MSRKPEMSPSSGGPVSFVVLNLSRLNGLEICIIECFRVCSIFFLAPWEIAKTDLKGSY